jgi:acetyl esterase/lipase
MASNFLRHLFFIVPIILCFVVASYGQDAPSSAWATDVGSRYWVQPDIVYQGANNTLLKLDVWYQHDVKTLSPTLVYFHGGGWIFGTKEGSVLQFLPFLEKGLDGR